MSIPQEIELKNDKYIKEALIDGGSYGEVWRMKRVSDGVIVAVKTIQTEDKYKNTYSGNRIKKAKESLSKEINFLQKLKNPDKKYILPLYDYGVFKDRPYMVIPLADNCLADIYDLAKTKRLNRKEIQLTPKRLFKWIIQITTGLQYVHNTFDIKGKRHVYRDVKFENVLLINDNAFLCDFGTVKPKSEEDLTSSHICSPKFAAPEFLIPRQFENNKHEHKYSYFIKADIFSLGISLFCLITKASRATNFKLDYYKKIDKYIGDNIDKPDKGIEKHFGKVGGLLPEERKKLKNFLYELFGIERNNESTHLGLPAVMLPNKENIAEKLVILITKMLSPNENMRPDTKKIIQIVKKLCEYYFPELLSFKIEAPEFIETGNPIEFIIHAKGKGLLNDGSWLYITLHSEANQSIKAELLNNEKKHQWKVVFNPNIAPGIYTLNVTAYTNNKEELRQSRIEVLPRLELSNLLIEVNDYEKSGTPIEVYITITGKFLKEDAYMSSLLHIIIHNDKTQKEPKSIICEKNNQLKATFDPELSPGSYTLTVKPKLKKYEKLTTSRKINVLGDPLSLWEKKEYVFALIQDSKHKKKWLESIYKDSKNNGNKRKQWLSVLEKVRKYDKNKADINALYWRIKDINSNYKNKSSSYFLITFCSALLLLITLGGYIKVNYFSVKTFDLNIQTIPSNATVWINNNQEYYRGLQLAPGEYQIEIVKNGYISQTRKITITNSNLMYVIELQPELLYQLFIDTIPKDANIKFKNPKIKYFDGIKLTPGNYEIVISKYGYEKRKDIITIENKNKYETIKLKKIPYNSTRFKFPKVISYKVLKNNRLIDNSQLRFETINDTTKYYQISLHKFDFNGYNRKKIITTFVKVNEFSFLSSIISEDRKKISEIILRKNYSHNLFLNGITYEFHDYSSNKNMSRVAEIPNNYKFLDFISLFVFLSKNIYNKQLYSTKINLFVFETCYIVTCNYPDTVKYKIKGKTIKTEKFILTYQIENSKRSTKKVPLVVFYIYKNLKGYTFPVRLELIGDNETFKFEATDFLTN